MKIGLVNSLLKKKIRTECVLYISVGSSITYQNNHKKNSRYRGSSSDSSATKLSRKTFVMWIVPLFSMAQSAKSSAWWFKSSIKESWCLARCQAVTVNDLQETV